jgi:hypothetical protein
MLYTEQQQIVIDRYLEATKNFPEHRISIPKLLGIKSYIRKSTKNDSFLLSQMEENYANESIIIKAGNPRRQIDNKYVSDSLGIYLSYLDAKKCFYWLDDILTGVSFLDLGGNTRPLSVGMLFTFMSTSSIINSKIVQDYCQVGERQSRKIMLSLVICNRMIEKELRRMRQY